MTAMTAQEAWEISRQNDPETIVENILTRVKTAAQSGKYSIQIRDHGFGGGEYHKLRQEWPETGKKVIVKLHDLGFNAAVNSDGRQLVDIWGRQFVDVWLEVSWVKGGAA